MDPLQRVGVIEGAAELLEAEIASGRITGQLPSSRNLAVLLRVSRPTVLQALHLMERKGVIAQTGPRGTFCVMPTGTSGPHGKQDPERLRHALYILDQEIVRHDAFELLLSLAIRLHREGWRVTSMKMNFGHDEHRPKQWQRAIEGHAPDKVIVWSGRPRLAQWLHRAGIPALFIGGAIGDAPTPIVAVSAAKAVGVILETYLCLGHRRIWFPLCSRPLEYASRLRESVTGAFEARGVPFSERMTLPTSPYRGPDIMVAMFEEALRSFRPTALIFHDWREYLAVSSVLRREGLDIPKDISVALIGDDPEMKWHRPEIAHFEAPLSRISNACVQWLIMDDPQQAPKLRSFGAIWMPGGSIAVPRGD